MRDSKEEYEGREYVRMNSIWGEIEIHCNYLPIILLAIRADNCERTLVEPTFSSMCSGSSRPSRAGRFIRGPLTI